VLLLFVQAWLGVVICLCVRVWLFLASFCFLLFVLRVSRRSQRTVRLYYLLRSPSLLFVNMLSTRAARVASRFASQMAGARSASTLIVAPHNGGELDSSISSLATAAQTIGGEVHVLVAGTGIDGAAAEAATYPGVTKVLVADNAAFDNGIAENLTKLVVDQQAAGGYSHIITTANNYGKNFLPRVAAKLDVAMLTDVSAILGDNEYERPTYAGNAIATVKSSDSVQLLSIRATSFEKAAPGGDAAAVEAIETGADADLGLTTFESAALSTSDRPELTSAEIVVSGGRGMQNAEGFETLLDPLCVKLNAAMGASRAAVDAGFVPNDLQIGQTGKVVAPELYIAAGISGAIQHLAGMKDSKTIVVINKDADAPFFQVRRKCIRCQVLSSICVSCKCCHVPYADCGLRNCR